MSIYRSSTANCIGGSPSVPTIGFTTTSSAETETNETFTSQNIPITVSNYNGTPISINVTVTGGSAETSDYVFGNPTPFTFTDNGTQNVNIGINDDLDTDDETIILTITETSSVTGLVISQATHTLTITDDGVSVPQGNDSFTTTLSDTDYSLGPDYSTYNQSSIPRVVKRNGRFLADVQSNANNITTFYQLDSGRIDYKEGTFPFEAEVINVRITTDDDTLTTLPFLGSEYVFGGLQVHNKSTDENDFNNNDINYAHAVKGHRGGIKDTVEFKNTVNGVSSQDDIGYDMAVNGADIRVEANASGVLSWFWRPTGDLIWQAHNPPNTQPVFDGNSALVGLIAYAFYEANVPYYCVIDSFRLTNL